MRLTFEMHTAFRICNIGNLVKELRTVTGRLPVGYQSLNGRLPVG